MGEAKEFNRTIAPSRDVSRRPENCTRCGQPVHTLAFAVRFCVCKQHYREIQERSQCLREAGDKCSLQSCTLAKRVVKLLSSLRPCSSLKELLTNIRLEELMQDTAIPDVLKQSFVLNTLDHVSKTIELSDHVLFDDQKSELARCEEGVCDLMDAMIEACRAPPKPWKEHFSLEHGKPYYWNP